ncbi:hypothetical protein K7432_014073 [Basidiobolus ranarum]|uniref:Berberine/berberine-like domain-containing protein n=1 Tax=Basidiobolus ranarum TaxID=34480 RepID=A0ABR2VQV4_9FUNG
MRGVAISYPTFYSWYQAIITETSGSVTALGSRLIPRKNFETDEKISQFTDTLLKVQGQNKEIPILGHLVAGGAVSHSKEETSVLPAWRDALWHIVVSNGWSDNSTIAEQHEIARNITRTTKFLRDITPGSGSYLNEADVNEPEWQQSFFGNNYPRLKVIKMKYDPSGLFMCRKCVGSEEWSEDLNCRV